MKRPTPKQEKLINGLIANAVDPNQTKSYKKIALEAGYSERSAYNPQKLTNSPTVLARTEKVIQAMERVRIKAIQRMNKTMDRAPLNHATDAMDKTTKNIQLLQGRATDNVAINVQISEAVAAKNA